jgi:hypothetical protein
MSREPHFGDDAPGYLHDAIMSPTQKKLTKLEESVIIEHILDLDSRGFSPKLSAVTDMANKLLTVHAGTKIGIKCVANRPRFGYYSPAARNKMAFELREKNPEFKPRFNRSTAIKERNTRI